MHSCIILIYISIIVCTKNRAEELAFCLEVLYRQSRDVGDVEVIVIDNDSADNTKNTIQSYSSRSGSPIRYGYEAKAGLCNARNQGRTLARGQVLAYVDDDAVPHAGWIAVIREHFLAGRSDCLAGKTVLRLQDELPEWFPTSLKWVLGESQFGEREHELTPDKCPNGNNFAIRNEVFDAIGGFNPNIRLYCDEVDFFARARSMGFSFYYRPDLAVDHCVSAKRLTKPALREKAYQMGLGYALMVIGFNPGARFRLKIVAPYFYRIARVSLAWCHRPRFGCEFEFWQYSGTLRGLFCA